MLQPRTIPNQNLCWETLLYTDVAHWLAVGRLPTFWSFRIQKIGRVYRSFHFLKNWGFSRRRKNVAKKRAPISEPSSKTSADVWPYNKPWSDWDRKRCSTRDVFYDWEDLGKRTLKNFFIVQVFSWQLDIWTSRQDAKELRKTISPWLEKVGVHQINV